MKIIRKTSISAKDITKTAKIIPSFYKGGLDVSPVLLVLELQKFCIKHPSWGADLL
jgi:hypothetical protein